MENDSCVQYNIVRHCGQARKNRLNGGHRKENADRGTKQAARKHAQSVEPYHGRVSGCHNAGSNRLHHIHMGQRVREASNETALTAC